MDDKSQKTDGEAAGAAMSGEAEPSMADRARALVDQFEHAHKHNAPVTHGMLSELRALLPGESNPDPVVQG